MNICVQIYFWTHVLFGKYPGVDCLVYLKNLPVFESGGMILHSHTTVLEFQLLHMFANMFF